MQQFRNASNKKSWASLQEIACEFGSRHHTTVLHAVNKIEALRRTDEALKRTITRLVNAFAART